MAESHEQEILDKKRCPNCDKKTNPETDYNHIRFKDKICRTCISCRTITLRSVLKHQDANKNREAVRERYHRTKPLTLHERNDLLLKIIRLMPAENVKSVCEAYDIVIPPELNLFNDVADVID